MSETLAAGFARRDITPPVGTPLAGRAEMPPSRGVHDPLWVKAVYLSDGSAAAVLLCADLVLVPYDFATSVRHEIAVRLDLSRDAVVFCVSHTHSGPGVGPLFEWDGRGEYEADLRSKAVDVALEAASSSAPVVLTYARARRSDLSHNRRFVMESGKVVTHPQTEAGVVRPDGPLDPEIQAVLFRGSDGSPLFTLTGFGAHPTAMGWGDYAMSADYPYWIERTVKHNLGDGVESIFFPGALGDISDGQAFERHTTRGRAAAEAMGTQIGLEALGALEQNGVPVAGGLSVDAADVSLPSVPLDADRVAWAERLLARPADHDAYALRDARLIVHLAREWPAAFERRIPCVRLGQLAFYGVPGELFAWYGLEIKARSPFEHPFVLGLANDRVGYIADRVFLTKDIFSDELGFGARKLGDGDHAGDRIVMAAIRLS